MPTNKSNLEGTMLAFVAIFTVLLGVSYGLASQFRGLAVPWLVILIVSVVATLALRYIRSRR